MVFQAVVPSVELDKLAYREESIATAWMWADVQFITPSLPARFVKFVSARFPVLQTITRTELYQCSVLLIHSCPCMLGQLQIILVVVTFLSMYR